MRRDILAGVDHNPLIPYLFADQERMMKPGDLLKNLLQQKKAATAEELASKDNQNAGKSSQKGHANAHGGKVARVGRGAARGS